jgi:hypothetical protein
MRYAHDIDRVCRTVRQGDHITFNGEVEPVAQPRCTSACAKHSWRIAALSPEASPPSWVSLDSSIQTLPITRVGTGTRVARTDPHDASMHASAVMSTAGRVLGVLMPQDLASGTEYARCHRGANRHVALALLSARPQESARNRGSVQERRDGPSGEATRPAQWRSRDGSTS